MASYGVWQGGLASYGFSYSSQPVALVLGTHVGNEYHIIYASYFGNDYNLFDATYNLATYGSYTASYIASYGATYAAIYYKKTVPNVRAIEWV